MAEVSTPPPVLDRELRLKKELDSTYLPDKNDTLVNDKSLLDLDEARDEWFSNITDVVSCPKDQLSADILEKVDHAEVCEWVVDAAELIDHNESVIKHLLSIVNKSQNDLIIAQQKLVKLQEELLENKNEQLRKLKLNVSTTVQNTVKEEIRSFSEVLKSVPEKSPVCEETLKSAVKSAIEEEDRSKNIIVFGLEEEEDEQLTEKVKSMFDELGEIRPKFEVSRIGTKRSQLNNIKPKRPAKIVFTSSSTTKLVLSKAKQLKQTKLYSSVYLSPDRSSEERAAYKQLVIQLKEKRASDPGSHHFIRDGKICNILKNNFVHKGG